MLTKIKAQWAELNKRSALLAIQFTLISFGAVSMFAFLCALPWWLCVIGTFCVVCLWYLIYLMIENPIVKEKLNASR